MRSVKPGRGPSFMGLIGSAAAVVFGIFWTVTAASMGAPVFFPIFGVIFIVMGIVQAVYNFKNATGTNRFSSFDITDDREEPDPLNGYFGARNAPPPGGFAENNPAQNNFCPYCGAKTRTDFTFCNNCGKKLL